MFAGCPISWRSKLQTVIALCITESGYNAPSMAMRKEILFVDLMQEISKVSDNS